MLTVSEHVYDEATGIDHYVFEPGAMKAQVKVTETNGEPQVLLGVEGMAVQQSVSEPTWTVCMNKEIDVYKRQASGWTRSCRCTCC